MAEKTKYQKKYKILKGDSVQVVAGKYNGERGKVLSVDKKKDRILVDGVNIVKRHTKPSMSNQDGGILEKTMPLHISNVMLLDPKQDKPTRVGYKIEGGKKVRFAKVSGTIL